MADKSKPVLILSKPPKPIDEMTDAELDEYSLKIYEALFVPIEPLGVNLDSLNAPTTHFL